MKTVFQISLLYLKSDVTISAYVPYGALYNNTMIFNISDYFVNMFTINYYRLCMIYNNKSRTLTASTCFPMK
jgi:hypothetical protein